MLANRALKSQSYPTHPLPSGYVLATDDDFSLVYGSWRYIGTKPYIIIPPRIKGNPIDNYSMMFSDNTSIQGVCNYLTLHIKDLDNMFNDCKSTSALELKYMDVSRVTSLFQTFCYCEASSIDMSTWDTSNVRDMSVTFYNAYATSLNLAHFDTSKVTTMSSMFLQSQMTSLNISTWDTSNVEDMSDMFATTNEFDLNLSHFDTSKVIYFYGMFSQSSINLSGIENWDTHSANDMAYFFNSYDGTTPPLDLSNWDTGNVTRMRGMFQGTYCEFYGMGSWNTSNVTDMSSMFYGYTSYNFREVIIFSNWDTSNVTNFSDMFRATNGVFTGIDNFNTSSATNMQSMFRDMDFEFSIDFSNWDTSNVEDMSYMFNYSNLTISGISNWNVGNVSDMGSMFGDCTSPDPLTIDLSTWDVRNVLNMNGMFRSCHNLTVLGLEHWETSKLRNIGRIFAYWNKAIPNISTWDVSEVHTFSSAFSSAGSYDAPLDLSSWDTSSALYMTTMFSAFKCTTLNVSNFKTGNSCTCRGMFESIIKGGTRPLPILTMTNFDTSKVIDMKYMFQYTAFATLDLRSFTLAPTVVLDSMFLATKATTGYAKNSTIASQFNNSTVTLKPSTLNFVVP